LSDFTNETLERKLADQQGFDTCAESDDGESRQVKGTDEMRKEKANKDEKWLVNTQETKKSTN
jgi:hypothetical protein